MRYEDAKQKEVDIFTHPKMQEAKAIKKLTQAFSDKLKEGFTGGCITGKMLTFFFKHPLYVHEFRLGHSKILENMRKIYKKENLAGVIYFSKVEPAVAPYKKSVSVSDSKITYEEKSTGNFRITCENQKIRSLFEDIREIVRDRVKDEGERVKREEKRQ